MAGAAYPLPQSDGDLGKWIARLGQRVRSPSHPDAATPGGVARPLRCRPVPPDPAPTPPPADPARPGVRVVAAVMCKVPAAGRTKTRLTPDLTPDQAAGVARAFLRHAATATADQLGGLGVSVALCCAPAGDLAGIAGVVGDAATSGAFPQCDGDLGDRMAAAVGHLRSAALDDGRPAAVLVLGTDSPDVPAAHLASAVGLLAGGADVVLGPTDDGGYWCLGVGPSADPAALLTVRGGASIDWSSGREFGQTLDRAGSLGLTVALAPAWPDVDRPADLLALLARLSRSPDPGDRRLLGALNSALSPDPPGAAEEPR